MDVLIATFGAVLLAVLALAWPALIHRSSLQAGEFTRPHWKRGVLWDLVLSELGFVVTYLSDFKNTNTTTAPVGAEAANLPVQVAQLFFADTDSQGIVVHNWGILLGQSFATFGWPICEIVAILGGGTNSFSTNFTFGLTNSNQVYVNKPVGTGTGGTFLLYMFLPSTYMARAR